MRENLVMKFAYACPSISHTPVQTGREGLSRHEILPSSPLEFFCPLVNAGCFKLYEIMTLIPSRLIRQMLGNIFAVEFWRTVSKFGERGSRCYLSRPSSTKREFRHFHVIVVQRRQRNAYKKAWCTCKVVGCFANRNLLLFCRSCCRRCRRRLSRSNFARQNDYNVVQKNKTILEADLVANKPHSELSEKKEKRTAGKHHFHSKYVLSSGKLKQTGAPHAVVCRSQIWKKEIAEPQVLKTQDGSLSDLFVTVNLR